MPRWCVNLTLILCFFECLTFGGTVFGWALLTYVYKAEGVYEQACIKTPEHLNTTQVSFFVNATSYHVLNGRSTYSLNGSSDRNPDTDSDTFTHMEDCSAQDRHFSLAFSVSIALMGVFAFPAGRFFDKFGLMKTRLCATCLCLPSLLMLATCNGDSSWMIYPALSMLAVVNIMIMVTNNHVCTLAGDRTSTMIALYSGAVNCSGGFVFILVKIAFDHGISRFASLLALAACWSLVLVTTFVLLPKFKVVSKSTEPNIPSPENSKEEKGDQDERTSLSTAEEEGIPRIVKSTYFIGHLIWFSLLHLRMQFFMGSFLTWSTTLLSGDVAQVDVACDVFGYSQFMCVITSPISGLFMDYRRRAMAARQVVGRKRAIGTVPSLLLASGSMALFGACAFLPPSYAVLVTPPVSQIARSLFYSTAFASVDFVFPKEHFGTLMGITYFIGGPVAFLQHAFFTWAEYSDFTQVNIGLLVVSLITLGHPLCTIIQHRRHTRRTLRNL